MHTPDQFFLSKCKIRSFHSEFDQIQKIQECELLNFLKTRNMHGFLVKFAALVSYKHQSERSERADQSF